MKRMFKLAKYTIYGNKIKIAVMMVFLSVCCMVLSGVLGRYHFYDDYYNIFDADELQRTELVDIEQYISVKTSELENDIKELIKVLEEHDLTENFETDFYKNSAETFDASNARYIKKLDYINQLKKMPAVEKVYYQYFPDFIFNKDKNKAFQSCTFMSIDTYRKFFYSPVYGEHLDTAIQTSPYPNAVVSGNDFVDVNIGDDITVTARIIQDIDSDSLYQAETPKYTTKEYKIHIVGKVMEPSVSLSYLPSQEIDLSYPYNNKNSSDIYLEDNAFNMNYFSDVPITAYHGKAMVVYKENCTEAEKNEVRNYCSNTANSYLDKLYKETNLKLGTNLTRRDDTYQKVTVNGDTLYNYFMENREALENELWQRLLPVVHTLCIVGLITAVSVFLMMYNRKREYLSVLYRVGASRAAIFGNFEMILGTALVFVGVLTNIISLLYPLLINVFSETGDRNVLGIIINPTHFSFKYDSFLYVWLYLLAIILVVSILMYLLIMRTNSGLARLLNGRVFFMGKKSQKKEMAKQKAESTEEYYEMLRQQNEKNKVLIHDINKHLSIIKNMSDSRGTEIADYINSITKDFDVGKPIDYCNNSQLNLIIERYKALCEQNGISLGVDVRASNVGFMSKPDITALFDNLLENAVEASKRSEKKFIDLIVHTRRRNFQVIIVDNSADDVPRIDKNMIKTTKPGSLHGMGLISIHRIAEKYDGRVFLSYEEENHTFHATIVIPNHPFDEGMSNLTL